MAYEQWPVLLASAGISLVLCLLLMPVARKTGLLDHPAERKVHSHSVPLVGGTAIYLSMILVITLATPYAVEISLFKSETKFTSKALFSIDRNST